MLSLTILISLTGCAEQATLQPKTRTIVLQPGEVVISAAELARLRQAASTPTKEPSGVTATCSSDAAQIAHLSEQIAAARAGDPGYQRLQAKVDDLQNRLNQAQQRESELRKKLNELIQIEKSAHLSPGK